MNLENLPDPTPPHDLAPLEVIRTETALSRFPVHRIAKRGDVRIEIKNQATAVLWRVSHNSEYGQPGPLAYKLDTLVVNRKIEEAGRPAPKVIRLGSLRDICRELGNSEGGESTQKLKRALLQNAFAGITAKITYRGSNRTERTLEAAFTRYSVVFTGESLPDGRTADAVHLVLNDIYQEVLNHALTRPLDYEYMKSLAPGAQRFYEIVSYQVYAALYRGNPRAKLTYSDYCLLSTQTRYDTWDKVKKQMYKVHRDHLNSGYLAKVEYETIMDSEGRADWNMYYTPGPNAAAEFRAFRGGVHKALSRVASAQQRPASPDRHPAQPLLALPFDEEGVATDTTAPMPPAPRLAPVPTLAAAATPMRGDLSVEEDPIARELIEQLVASDLNPDRAVLYARQYPAECRRQLEFVRAMADGDFTSGRGAYLNEAIPGRYGPPKQYRQVQQEEEAARQRAAETERQNARKSAQEARRETILADLRKSYTRMEKEHPGLYKGFRGHVERELQVALRRFPSRMAQEANRRIYSGEPKRLELFAAYFEVNPCPLPELTEWLKQHTIAERRTLFTDRG